MCFLNEFDFQDCLYVPVDHECKIWDFNCSPSTDKLFECVQRRNRQRIREPIPSHTGRYDSHLDLHMRLYPVESRGFATCGLSQSARFKNLFSSFRRGNEMLPTPGHLKLQYQKSQKRRQNSWHRRTLLGAPSNHLSPNEILKNDFLEESPLTISCVES